MYQRRIMFYRLDILITPVLGNSYCNISVLFKLSPINGANNKTPS